ncbi:MAG TPA: AgmX/PglI C-terminal domain-containing protein [Polyangiales bacterium]|nr:AgmX/PglI C-terminal domain-containing protein [Polyangiales bacterium]
MAARLRTVAPPLDLDAPYVPPKPSAKPAPTAVPAAARAAGAPAGQAARAPATTKPTAEAPTAAARTTVAPSTGARTTGPAKAGAPTAAAPAGGSPTANTTSTPAAGKTATGKTATGPATASAPTAGAPTAVAAAAPAPPQASPKVSVKGLTGTLNTDDVHQTMEAQQAAFNACIEHGRRSVRWVDGAMRFAFKVDASGRVLDAHPIESTLGHRELERCLSETVSTVVFPKPAGRASAQFAWTVTVVPVGTPADPLDAKGLAKLLRKQRRSIARGCELRPRERFQVTAYVAQTGEVLSAGGFALRARGAEKVDCVLEAVGELRLPKVPRRSRVSFRL